VRPAARAGLVPKAGPRYAQQRTRSAARQSTTTRDLHRLSTCARGHHFFAATFLEHFKVELTLRQDLLQPLVFGLERLQSLRFSNIHGAEAAAPPGISRARNAETSSKPNVIQGRFRSPRVGVHAAFDFLRLYGGENFDWYRLGAHAALTF
jgi:hypothetical protein